jgi:hypothetical protein
LPQVGALPKAFFQLLTSVKRVGVQFTEDFGTTLPGYMDSTKLLGYNPKAASPVLILYSAISLIQTGLIVLEVKVCCQEIHW